VARPRLDDNLTARRAGTVIGAATLIVAIAGGVLMRVIDPHDFPTVESGLWWAIQTVTTVGYGDHVPSDSGGRALAAFVMITGIGFLSVITAAISATFVEAARRRRQGAGNVTMQELAERLDRIERALESRKD
jgi:voltage-gated potassium channel